MATSIPPHNVSELIDAASHLIDNPGAETRDLMDFVSGPDFPTGGVIVDAKEAITLAYETGRGSFRVRASVSVEKEKGGGWHLLVSEIPYGVQKGKLIEDIAELIGAKKLPILEDVRDESAEDVRIVLEPRSRTVDPQLLLESLYRLTDLEIRFPLNLNVLDASRTPGVMSLRQALTAWLAFQIEVMLNRSRTRIGKIDDRLELLDGFLVAFLNLDRVIEIIRTEDEPKAVMIAEFSLTERQAEAILNMRLRSLRKLEEMEIGRERKALAKEREELTKLVESPQRQRNRLKKELAAVRDKFGDPRRTRVEEGPSGRAEIDWSAMIEREPITVILSQRGWIRAMKGHAALDDAETLKFREGDALQTIFHAQTTDKLLLVGENGRVYTLGGDKLPGGRGFGEPVRLSIDLAGEVEIAGLFVVRPEMKLLVASSDGRGFITSGEAVLAETRKGKQLLNLREGATLKVLRPVPEGADAVAVMGENRKMLLFALSELPEMGRGAGVQLQRYRDGGLADVTVLKMADGLSWSMGGDSGRTRTEADLTPWRAIRGASGRMAPLGFPRSNRF
jgi:topoisomerase-4 subunit A